MKRVWPFLALAAAAWPSFGWYFERVREQPWYLLPLALVALHLAQRARTTRPTQIPRLAILCVLGYALTQSVLPPLFATLWIVLAATLLAQSDLGDERPSPGVGALFLLALPVIPSLQMVIGYPFRVLSGEVAVFLLRLGGVAAERSGAMLVRDGQMLAIDAPCSGIKMWWMALILAAWWATRARRGVIGASLAAAGATFLVLLANGLRAASLTQLDSIRIPTPSWTHTAVGLVSFALCAIPPLLLLERAARKEATCRVA